MKKHTLGISLAAAFGLLFLATPSARADLRAPNQDGQHANRQLGAEAADDVAIGAMSDESGPVFVRVPFMFAAGNTVLPPGDYTVKVNTDDPTVIRLVSSDGRSVAALETLFGTAVDGGLRAHFAFKEYGKGDYVLASVALPGDAVRMVPMPRKEVAKDLAKMATLRYDSQKRALAGGAS